MFKNKGFLYGLGLGLILGASLLQLMNFSVMEDKPITNLIESASPSSSPSAEPLASVEPFATIKPTKPIKPTETIQNPDSPSPQPTTIPAATPITTKTNKPAAPTPVATIDKPAASTPFVPSNTVIIEKGMSSAQVSSLLFKSGIITDQKAFDKALSELNLDRIIKIGTFTFLPDEKDEDIINKITTHK